MASKESKEYTNSVIPIIIKYADGTSYEYTEEQLQDAFDAGVESEKKKHEWHNWLEKPSVYPNFGICVLTRFDGGNYQVCTYNSMNGCWYSQNGEINLYVDSWKEIE